MQAQPNPVPGEGQGTVGGSVPAEPRSTIDREMKARELALEEAKLRQERELRERELTVEELKAEQDGKLKAREIDVQQRQIAIGRWSGPVAVAVVAGIVGIIGSFVSSCETRDLERRKQEGTLELERKKQEGTLVLEAIRTGSTGKQQEKQAAANLVFLADAGLINLGKDQLQKLRDRAGDAAPGLPSPVQQPTSIPEGIRQRILQSFKDFAAYFESLGAKNLPTVGVETAPAEMSGFLAYYDPGKRTVFIDPDLLSDVNVPLREYAHAVLYSDPAVSGAIAYDKTWVYQGIESGLASYFAASFAKEARIPGSPTHETLANSRKITDVKEGTAAMWDGTLAWGGAFWELRTALGQQVADKLLYDAWSSVKPPDLKANDPLTFESKILEADRRLNQGQNRDKIKSVFNERGLSL